MEKIILDFSELFECWNEDTPTWEFAEWFLDNAPELPNSSELKEAYIHTLGECYGDDIDESASWVQAAWHAHLELIAYAYGHGKEYSVVPNHDYITWHGKLNYDFTLAKVEA